jgi:hypothetical protein
MERCQLEKAGPTEIACRANWRARQKRIPGLRPIARQIVESAHDLFAKPLTL